jgi:hypothetical protein
MGNLEVILPMITVAGASQDIEDTFIGANENKVSDGGRESAMITRKAS